MKAAAEKHGSVNAGQLRLCAGDGSTDTRSSDRRRKTPEVEHKERFNIAAVWCVVLTDFYAASGGYEHSGALHC